MKTGQVGRAAGLVIVVHYIQQIPRLGQVLARLVEMFGGFRRYRSTPSKRISRIRDVRSS